MNTWLLNDCNPLSTTVYVSGPMTGMVDSNFPLFDSIASDLRREGYAVRNPAETESNIGQDWHTCIRTDLKDLLECNAVVFLPQWEKSKGATIEHAVAKALNMQLFRLNMADSDMAIPTFSRLEDTKDETILEEAQRLVLGHRNVSYDHPYDNFTRIAKLWSVVLNVPVTPEHIGLCMILTKVAREMHAHTRDNLVDIAGYAMTVEQVLTEMERRASSG